MVRTRWLGWGVGLLALVVALPVQAEETSLARVPANAPIVVHLRGLERTKERIGTLIKNMLPDLGPLVVGQAMAQLDEAIRDKLNGKELKGLSDDGSIFLVFTELPKPDAGHDLPMMAAILPVTKYREFLDGLLDEDARKALKAEAAGYEVTTVNDHELYFVEGKGYAVVTPKKEVALQFAKKKGPGLDTTMNPDLAKQLLATDMAFYVNLAAVNKQYGDHIKASQQQFIQVVEQLLQASGQVDKNTQEMFKNFYNGFFQVLEDCKGLLFTLDFRPEGLAIHLQANVGAEGKTNAFLKNAKPVALADLGKLSVGQLFYYAMEMSPELGKVFEGVMKASMAGADGKETKILKEALDLLGEASPEQVIGDISMPAKEVQVWRYKDPVKAAEAQLKLVKALENEDIFKKAMLKGKPEIKANAETYRGFKLNYVRMEFDLDKMTEAAGKDGKVFVEAMKKMMGDGLESWFGTDGKVYVKITAKDWASAQGQLDKYLDGKDKVGDNKAFLEARKQLPAKATVVFFTDMPVFVQMVAEVAMPIIKAQGLPIPPIQVPKAPKGKSYLGVALTFKPESGSFDLWIPGSMVPELRQMFNQFQPGAGGAE